MKRLWAVLLLLAGSVVVAGPAQAAVEEEDILDQLRKVPGLTVVEEQTAPAPYRFFVLTITQAADHRDPSAGTFEQRMTLLHRGTDRPTVLHTTGYGVPGYVFRAEPTRLIDGNQLSVEQRFFTPSRPAPADWSDLTIWQAATDHHRIVEALAPLYPAKWISTGASKGGMTSIYHRRFYPSDVDGTVAYVAPQDVVNREDSAYDKFFTTVGTDAACRAALDNVQIEALKRRSALVARYEAWATANNRTFTIVESADRAFEFLVNGAPWAFWQYSGQSQCGSVPATTASDEAILGWLDAVFGLDANTDQGISGYVPYYFQAAAQLGYPVIKLKHLAKLQRYPGEDRAESYVPSDLHPRFHPLAMTDIDLWVRLAGRELLFVYGQNDPWGAEPFHLGPGTRDSLSYVAAGANHGANISLLTPEEAATATAALQRWAGVTAKARQATAFDPVLDAYNPALDRRYNR
ncbi:S28 family serine protease [Actinoplanes friuliensis]|uniref:Peptidase S37 tripeptidyl aminopeptidase n=1 Tax=Actinoplanes friuliensis DSM 7358 TaxID=1246995 RepID=U5W1U3_9ACTN|nr:S28 family serine protease [Actinoplanes friuliensis]AGZ41896.1 peptidase S37 tripeptidyl aminopeptidase [Actinoplanes friuliensis DSM 7358]